MSPELDAFGFEDLEGYISVLSSIGSLALIRPMMVGIAAVVHRQTKQHIYDERDPWTGQAWAELSDPYSSQRQARGEMLELSGDMMDELAYVMSGSVMTFGSKHEYASVHQEGSDTVPQRRFLGFTAGDETEIADEIADYIYERVRLT